MTPCGKTLIPLVLCATGLGLACLGFVIILLRREGPSTAPRTSALPKTATIAGAAAQRCPPVTNPHPVQAGVNACGDVTVSLIAEVRSYADAITGTTGRLDRLSGEDAVALLRATPTLADQLDLAERIGNSCRNYAAGAWFLSNVYAHALIRGSITDQFRAGWYWGDFCAAHHQFDDAIHTYRNVVQAVQQQQGLKPSSYMLLLNNLTITLGMAQYADQEKKAARELREFVVNNHQELSNGDCAFGFMTYLTALYNQHEFYEAKKQMYFLQQHFPHIFQLEHSPLKMMENCLQDTCDDTAKIVVSLGDLRPD
jgi:hypothetical protein